MLRERYGRAEVEQVLSGPGLLNLHRLTHRGGECAVVDDLDAPDAPAAVSQGGPGGRCQGCAEALHMFVSAYGAEAGNLALRGLALGGVYVGGGIAPKILPAIQAGAFMLAFLDKAPMTEMLLKVPVKDHPEPTEAGLLGAASCANELAVTAPTPDNVSREGGAGPRLMSRPHERLPGFSRSSSSSSWVFRFLSTTSFHNDQYMHLAWANQVLGW